MRPMVDADGHLDELLDEGIACLDSPLAEEVIAGRGHSLASHWQVAGNRARTLGNDSSHRSDRVHLGPAGRLAVAERVVFVDARAGAAPGRVDCRPVTLDAEADPAFSHHLLPGALLQLSRTLYGAGPPAWVVTVDAAAFGYHTDLSPLVADSVPVVVERVRTMLDSRGADQRESC